MNGKTLKAILTYKDLIEHEKFDNRLTLKEKKFEKYEEFSDFTVCWRSNIIAFSGKDIRSFLFGFGENLGEKDGKLTYKEVSVALQDPESPWHGLVWYFVSTEKIEEVIRSGTGTWSFRRKFANDVNARQWNHFCIQSSKSKRMVTWVYNGEIFANVSQPEYWANDQNFLTTDMLNPYFKNKTVWQGFYLHRISNAKFIPSGYITDFQIWKTDLSLQDMADITTCKKFPEGNLLQWNADDYTSANTSLPYQYEIVEIESDGLCSRTSNYEFFPEEAASFDGAFVLCKRFGGNLLDAHSSEDYEKAFQYILTLKQSPEWENYLFEAYLRFSDRDVEGIWVDEETGEDMTEKIPWDYAEPNGEVGENCGFLFTKFSTSENEQDIWRVGDISCVARQPVICENIPQLKFSLRGLCSDSLFDTRFLLRMEPKNGNRFFSGSYGWDIFFESGNWVIQSTRYNTTKAVHSGIDYPLGRNSWQIDNDRCPSDGREVVLNLTPCSSSEFTCDNGVCIPMEFRCDQKSDCEDVSDEKGCKIIFLDANRYLKDKPPPPTIKDKKVSVNVSMNLLDILEINEVSMLFKTKFQLFLEWYDPRITFYNLKDSVKLNTLIPDEIESIWIPRITYKNTEKNDGSIRDKETFGSVNRKGNFTASLIDHLDNIYLFDGYSNPITINRVYETEWICTYNMAWYPFDTQTCSMILITTGETGNFVELQSDVFNYFGPKELTRYFIRRSKMNKLESIGVSAEVTLGRRLLATILTVFLPTVLLNVIGHSTNYFRPFFFEAVVTVNLTVMLVLTTMFISVSNALPETSYVKMIDLWLLFNLILPFSEVLLHTYKVYWFTLYTFIKWKSLGYSSG